MDQVIHIGPMDVSISEGEAVFRFVDADSLLLEIPPTLESDLARSLHERCAELKGKTLVFDLAGLPAVNSRQLGMVLTVRKACEAGGPFQLRGVSPGVRRVLELTRMLGFFDIEPK
jgi:anti-anti-sigma regulatory factor